MQTRPALAHPSSALRLLCAGLVLTAAVTLAPFIDIVTADTVTDHVRAAYPDWPSELVRGDRNAIVAYLGIVGVLGLVGWGWSLWAVVKRKRLARAITAVWFGLGASITLAGLTVTGGQYDQVLPPLHAALSLLPVLVGLIAVIVVSRVGPDEATTPTNGTDERSTPTPPRRTGGPA